MTDGARTSVLFVDDEPNLLAAVARVLRATEFDVKTAPDGATALETLRTEGPFAVIVSDLRMPRMDGVTLLRTARGVAPDTVRILMTGQADLEGAISAINEGSIFRFITKPCPSLVLQMNLRAAIEQYRLVTAERVLLEQTLHGSIKALTDVLALASPVAFGRAGRLRQRVKALVASLSIRDWWHVEVAAMLSQIGCVILPPATLEKLYHGGELGAEERAMAERMPAVIEQVLGHIPRLEPVLEILRYQHKNYDGTGTPPDDIAGQKIPWGARVLRLVTDLDAIESRGSSFASAVETLRSRAGAYDPSILDALAGLHGSAHHTEVRQVCLDGIRPGMVLSRDVKTRNGLLLCARGQEVTASLLQRLRNFSVLPGIQEPLRVAVSEHRRES
jgi:response regulator RpfG family c-di-GMP phosphodiesterase